MDKKILDYYRSYGIFTYPGRYEEYLRALPDDIYQLGDLLRRQFIHRTTLDIGNKGTNADMKYGDMYHVPWYRQSEDDLFNTSVAMTAELFRRDSNGFTKERKVADKVILTCRYISILMASILKAKGIPARVRSGFAGYFEGVNASWDHWIMQYYDEKDSRWVSVDVDASWHNTGFDLYDIPQGKFDFSADAWLAVRKGERNADDFKNAGSYSGFLAVCWELFYDFHCLMNSEILYLHIPVFATPSNFKKLSEEKLREIDDLARLMQDPDKNFDELQKIWENKKEFRLLTGALL
jgi:hypothetical protein